MFISEGYSGFQTLTLIDFIAQLVMVWTLPYFNFIPAKSHALGVSLTPAG